MTGWLVAAAITASATAVDISGHVDSSYIDPLGDNRVSVFAGSVTLGDARAGQPLYRVQLTQDSNACTFSYRTPDLAPGTYTIALGASKAAVVKVTAAAVATHDFTPATVLRVGPARPYATVQAAAAAADDGAVIEIDARTYDNDVVVWNQNNLTVRGVGGRPHIRATAEIQYASGDPLKNGKGLWVVYGANMRVENIELSGARVADHNGAGIRGHGRNLTICNSSVHDSENGFLGAANGRLTIEYSTFFSNGAGDGYTHNVYVDGGSKPGDQLIFRHNNTYGVRVGHLLKTRARENYILYNRLADEQTGTSSYNIDVPEGGLTYVIGNLIQQSSLTENATMVAYGAERLALGRTHHLYMVNNTLVNDRRSGTFVHAFEGTQVFRSINNLFVLPGTLYAGFQPQATTNLQSSSAGLVNQAALDYRLTASSPAVNAGTAPGAAEGFDLTPVFQYSGAARREPRPHNDAIDIGAFEFVP
jgi:hypothetical protein